MSLFLRFLLFLLTVVWLSGIFLPFFIPLWEPLINIFPFFNLSASRVCHQNPEKLIYINVVHSLVCARCAGIYSGAFAGSLYLLFFSKLRITARTLIAAGLPLIADVLFYTTGVYEYSHYIAFFTGVLFGTICFFYIFQGLNLLISEINIRKVN